MRKTRLKIDDLAIESFPTDDGSAAEAGTVRAHAATEGCHTFIFEGCGQTQFQTCAPTRLGSPCFCS
jgi:hypothetical protein